MTQNKNDLDSRLRYLLEKMKEEFEVVKRQGFPSRKQNEYSRFARKPDVNIAQQRWAKWANELGIDYGQLNSLLEVLKNEGLLEDYDFASEYM